MKKHWISLYGELALDGPMDLLQDRLLDDDDDDDDDDDNNNNNTLPPRKVYASQQCSAELSSSGI